jgi:uncharacterized protein (DUF1810 family)
MPFIVFRFPAAGVRNMGLREDVWRQQAEEKRQELFGRNMNKKKLSIAVLRVRGEKEEEDLKAVLGEYFEGFRE